MLPYTFKERLLFKKLSSPSKIQDYLNSLKINFEKRGETCMSPRFVLKRKTAHCMEGAMLAAAVLEFHGHKPLLLDLRARAGDFDHVVALFREGDFWGAISKTNHAVLRYREPIYRTIRELALSYFHEYFTDSGVKTLREYSRPFDLRLLDGKKEKGINWRVSKKNLFEIPKRLDQAKHYSILSRWQLKNLRKADRLEIKAGKLAEWKG